MINLAKVIDKFNDLVTEAFKDLDFDSDTHHYTYKGKEGISVTRFLDQFKEPFDLEYWSKRKADEAGITQDQMKELWETKNEAAKLKGTNVHSYIEHLFTGCELNLITESIYYEQTKGPYEICCEQARNFKENLPANLIPVAAELRMVDPEIMLFGTADYIFYNLDTKIYEVIDWKSNSKFTISSYYKLGHPFNNIPNSKLDEYSLQLGLYKIILEKITGLPFGISKVVHFSELNNNYAIYNCKDYSVELNKVIASYKLKIKDINVK